MKYPLASAAIATLLGFALAGFRLAAGPPTVGSSATVTSPPSS
ncbi:hypothetical protein [Arthrobacter sp. H35-D1]|nr:hypothetical protein [Arthrobacter sp. H35-D1]MDJ0315455.1 hypothetical protein [Arthrobacter sp. H35-D1]